MYNTTHMQREIAKLKKRILELSAEVERSLLDAQQALISMDLDKANKVTDYDRIIDQHEVDIEEECLKILALYQPVAGDLRMVVSILKINSDLERMGDLASNIGGYVKEIAKAGGYEVSTKFRLMTNTTREMVRKSLDALVNDDANLAKKVLQMDDEVDQLNVEIIHEIEDHIKGELDHLHALLFLISASRNIERIADIATNIAEDVYYMVKGEIIRHNLSER